MNRDEAIERAADARVGRMATVRPDGSPHVAPFVFALVRTDDGSMRIYWAVDAKPKRSTTLRRIDNLRTNPAVEVVVDAYDDEDWDVLWWVRMRGSGRVVASRQEREAALTALSSKYTQYRSREPSDDVIAIDVDSVTWWSARDAVQ